MDRGVVTAKAGTAPRSHFRRVGAIVGAMRRLLTYAEAADYLNVGVTTAKRLARDGEFPKVHVGHSVRFDVADLDAYIERRKGL